MFAKNLENQQKPSKRYIVRSFTHLAMPAYELTITSLALALAPCIPGIYDMTH